MTHCKVCGSRLEDKRNLYCRKHARQLLKTMEASGYLQPLTIRTQDGIQRLSNRRFLEMPEIQKPELPSS